MPLSVDLLVMTSTIRVSHLPFYPIRETDDRENHELRFPQIFWWSGREALLPQCGFIDDNSLFQLVIFIGKRLAYFVGKSRGFDIEKLADSMFPFVYFTVIYNQ